MGEYCQLEKKIIEKGRANFIKELQTASIPMLAVFKKYGIKNNHPILEYFKAYVPCDYKDTYSNYAIMLNDYTKISLIDSNILEEFFKEFKEIKERIDIIEDGL